MKNLDYKTIRYKGHCEKFKTLLDLGFATSEPMMVGGSVKTNREFFADLLRKKLDFGDKDVGSGPGDHHRTPGRRARRRSSMSSSTTMTTQRSMTAMMRTTAFPTSIIAQMLATR